MKKVMVVLLVIAMALLLMGCLNYKKITQQKDDSALVNEIANIEGQVNKSAGEIAAVNKADTAAAAIKTTGKTTNTTTGAEEKGGEAVALPINEKAAKAGENMADMAELPTFTLTVKENEMVRIKVNGSDADKDAVSYSFSKPLNQNGEWKTNYGDAGEYVVTISASDRVHTTEKKVKIVVQRINVAPIIQGLRNLTFNEGDTVNFEPKVSDPNKDPVTVSISDPLKKGKWVTDHSSAGTYPIKVTATDGELSTESSFTLTVKDVNVPPEITNVQDLHVKEGDVVKVQPIVVDSDENETVKVDIGSPIGNTGTWQTGYTDHGTYPITITADDGKVKVTKKITLIVDDVNVAPDITNVYLG